MKCHVHKDAAWLPLALCQHLQCDLISGGLCAIMRAVVSSCHSEGNLSGFPVTVHGQTLHFRVSGSGFFLSDQDAQRLTWCSKGSSGLKPCQFCSNVVKKNQGSERFHSIASHDFLAFNRVRDHEVLAAHRTLGTVNKKDRLEWERCYGFNYEPHGLLADERAFLSLPLTNACNDAMHGYFCNGVASNELSLVLRALEENGLTLQALRDLAVADGWRHLSSCCQRSFFAPKVARILSDKMFEGDVYKGEAEDTRVAVYLVHYYLAHRCQDLPMDKEKASFAALKKCCAELSLLHNMWKTVNDCAEVRPLHEAQLEHQRLFVDAYSEQSVKPKHHHRLHLAEAALKLGFLPNCTVHESKHRILKGHGLVNHQKARLTQALALQRSLLPRVLLSTTEMANRHGLGDWKLLSPIHVAPSYVRSGLGDASIVESQSMMLLQMTVRRNDVVFFPNDCGYMVDKCLRGDVCGMFLSAHKLQLVQRASWGSVWRSIAQDAMFIRVCATDQLSKPTWRRIKDDLVHCLH